MVRSCEGNALGPPQRRGRELNRGDQNIPLVIANGRARDHCAFVERTKRRLHFGYDAHVRERNRPISNSLPDFGESLLVRQTTFSVGCRSSCDGVCFRIWQRKIEAVGKKKEVESSHRRSFVAVMKRVICNERVKERNAFFQGSRIQILSIKCVEGPPDCRLQEIDIPATLRCQCSLPSPKAFD